MVKTPEDLKEVSTTGEHATPTAPEVVEINPTSPFWTLATDIEAAVFIEKGYVNDSSELRDEYRPYLESSGFLVATVDGNVVGSVRCIEPSEAGYKTLKDIELGRLKLSEEGEKALEAIPVDEMLEIGTLAVAPGFRSQDDGRIAVHLYGGIKAYMNERNLTHVIASFDERYFNSFKAIFGDTVQQLGPAVDYMGSPTIPAVMNIAEMHEHTKGISQELYDTIQEASENVHRI